MTSPGGLFAPKMFGSATPMLTAQLKPIIRKARARLFDRAYFTGCVTARYLLVMCPVRNAIEYMKTEKEAVGVESLAIMF